MEMAIAHNHGVCEPIIIANDHTLSCYPFHSRRHGRSVCGRRRTDIEEKTSARATSCQEARLGATRILQTSLLLSPADQKGQEIVIPSMTISHVHKSIFFSQTSSPIGLVAAFLRTASPPQKKLKIIPSKDRERRIR